MVFQDYPLFPHRTVRQNVAFGLHRLSKKEAARRVDELLEQVGLTHTPTGTRTSCRAANNSGSPLRKPWRPVRL